MPLNRQRRNCLLWLVIGFNLVQVTHLSAQKNPSSSEQERLVSVSTIQLTPTDTLEIKRPFTGQMEAKRRSQLGFDRIGRIHEIYVERGDEVQKGQLLAILDFESLHAQKKKLESDLEAGKALLREVEVGAREEVIAAARASLKEQESQLVFAEASFLRRDHLFQKKLIAKEEYDQALATRDRVEAMVQGARSRLEELENGSRKERIDSQKASVAAIAAAVEQMNVEIEKSKIFSPYDGKILQRLLDEGSIVSPGIGVLTLIEHRELEGRVGLTSTFAKEVAIDQKVLLECSGELIEGEIRSIIPDLDPVTRTQTVVVRLGPDAWKRAVPGDTFRVQLTQKKKSRGYWVPTESLVAGPRGLWNCFVVEQVDANGVGVAVLKTVELVHAEGERSMIAGSIDAGSLLVASAPHRIIANQRVRVLESAEPR